MDKSKMIENCKVLNVMQVNKYYYPHIGGIERIVQQIAEGLSERTKMTVLVSSEDKGRYEENEKNINLIRLPRNIKIGNMPVSISLFKELRKLSDKQDVIHLHMPFPIGDLACLLSGYRGKFVLWWHSDVVRQKRLMFFYKPIMKKMLQRADAIVVATKGHIEGSAYLKPYESKCWIIPFGVEESIERISDRYFDIKKNDIALWKVEKKPVRFLFVGRLVYYKGCDVLIKAFADVENAELYMAGTGELEEELIQLTKRLGITNKVHFVGKVTEEELCKQYEECDVFVLPSVARSEAFAIVQIEAMAFGKPVINTRLASGVPYVSVDKETGLTVEPGNVQELADAMRWMVENEEERLKMGDRARNKMKEEYRLPDMLEKVYGLYQRMVEE